MPASTPHRTALAALKPGEWDAYLLAHSGLPGPRANLELVGVAADLGTRAQFTRWAMLDDEYLPLCGAVGLGRQVAEGDRSALPTLRALASDPRWRVREGVAMGLQRWGDADLPALIKELSGWAKGNWLEQRAAAAALCEPRLLKDRPAATGRVLKLLDGITKRMTKAGAADRKGEDYKALRKGLAYCWSVAVAAEPSKGRPAMEVWLTSPDPDISSMMQENLKKDRLRRMDAAWVKRWQKH